MWTDTLHLASSHPTPFRRATAPIFGMANALQGATFSLGLTTAVVGQGLTGCDGFRRAKANAKSGHGFFLGFSWVEHSH